MTQEQIEKELGKFGYSIGNAVDVEILISEIIPKILKNNASNMKGVILNDVWAFCEKEFKADFEEDSIGGKFKKGLSDRTEKFVNELVKKI